MIKHIENIHRTGVSPGDRVELGHVKGHNVAGKFGTVVATSSSNTTFQVRLPSGALAWLSPSRAWYSPTLSQIRLARDEISGRWSAAEALRRAGVNSRDQRDGYAIPVIQDTLDGGAITIDYEFERLV